MLAEHRGWQAHTFDEFTAAGGGRIFRLPLRAFPNLAVYVYLVLVDGMAALIDTGSGFGKANEDLEAGLVRVAEALGHPFGLSDLTHIFVTHGHIDHFGGLPFIRERSQAKLGIHELDLRNLTNYEERLFIVERRLRSFLLDAGLGADQCEEILNVYRINKALFRSQTVDFTFEAEGMRVGPFEFVHLPGHTAGHVAIRLDDIVFSGDLVIAGISPHQSPERLTLYTGLDHYLRSLEQLRAWGGDARLTLAGHNGLIEDLPARLDEIRAVHAERLQNTLAYMGEAHTIAEVSDHLFGAPGGYEVLLALEETGAHVEYLYQRGLLEIENLAEIEAATGPVGIRYQRLNDPVAGRVRLLA